MDNVLTILIAVGGIAISLYMNARKKEKEKAKRNQQNSPSSKENIFETILSDLSTNVEVEKKQIEKQKGSHLNIFLEQPSFGKESIRKIENDKKEERILLEDEISFDVANFTLKGAIISEAILNRKYQ